MDRILIRDLLLRCKIGVEEEERREKQDVLINIVLTADLRKPAQSDRFEDTVDYRAIKEKVIAVVEKSEFLLVEALAEHIAEICLESPGVLEAQITVEKPSALRFARSVGVEITRTIADRKPITPHD